MKFFKMQAAGNDFILVNGFEYKNLHLSDTAKNVCDRHFGVGADGFITCSGSDIADIKMNFYNADGSRGGMCGNGIRCFSKFIYENGIVKKKSFSVETDTGIKFISLILENENVKYLVVDMGKVDFSPYSIPCNLDKKEVISEEIEILGKKMKISSVLMGVPHTVIFVDSYENLDINLLGEKIEKNKLFPKGTNVNFVKIIDSNTMEIKTWERGVGRTLGCGTGCCSSASIAYKLNKINSNKVKMLAEGGEIFVEIGDNYHIKMSGTAEIICSGEFLKQF